MPVKAVISLKNIVYNANLIKSKIPNGVKFCAVVKADAYGHGAEKVSSAIYPIVDCFAVATPKEGIALRLCGIDKDILVLTKTFSCDILSAVNYRLTLTVCDFNDLAVYEKAAKRLKTPVKIHIKFDTGMNRQGLKDEDELLSAVNFCRRSKYLVLDGLYSHFAAPENDFLRQIAIKRFLVAKSIVKEYNKKVNCHISASGGFIKGEFFDMVRIGILLYGYTPFDFCDIKVKPAMKVFAPVVTERKLFAGDCALYGEKRAKHDTDITLLRYGYADGLFRKEISGQFNNRCMDVTAIIGKADGKKVMPVMTDANLLAEKYKTIPYEILVKCALRAEREYI